MNPDLQAQEHPPRWGNAFTRWLGRSVLHLFGWRVEAELPPLSKFIIIGAPHTSNWDAIFGIAGLMAIGLRVNIFIKHSAFRWPFRGVLRWLGFVPIDRRRPGGVVTATVEAMGARRAMVLGLAPEGTRGKAQRWKQGFHRIAQTANVPILCVCLDYGRKRLLTGPLIQPGGDYREDMAVIRDFYQGAVPRHAERWSVPEV